MRARVAVAMFGSRTETEVSQKWNVLVVHSVLMRLFDAHCNVLVNTLSTLACISIGCKVSVCVRVCVRYTPTYVDQMSLIVTIINQKLWYFLHLLHMTVNCVLVVNLF